MLSCANTRNESNLSIDVKNLNLKSCSKNKDNVIYRNINIFTRKSKLKCEYINCHRNFDLIPIPYLRYIGVQL